MVWLILVAGDAVTAVKQYRSFDMKQPLVFHAWDDSMLGAVTAGESRERQEREKDHHADPVVEERLAGDLRFEIRRRVELAQQPHDREQQTDGGRDVLWAGGDS